MDPSQKKKKKNSLSNLPIPIIPLFMSYEQIVGTSQTLY